MSVFYDNNITDVGRMLIAETQTGVAKFQPTKIVIGSGFMPTGKTSRTMTAVAEPVAELELNKGLKTPDGSAVFGAAFTNKDITQPFYYRELALYAKAVYDDGTEGVETLYSYGNAGDNAELIPAYSANTIVERQLDLLAYIGNDTAVSLNITSGLYVDANTFNEAIYEMNIKITNVEENITPYGIGAVSLGTDRMEIPENADLNEYLHIGGYKCAATSIAATIENCPVDVAFIMDVISATGNEEEINADSFSYIIQRVYGVNGEEYFRPVSSNGTGTITFGDWIKVFTTSGGDINGHTAVHGNLSVDSIIYSKTFQQMAEHYGVPIEIGQYIDMHFAGSTDDVDGRISISADKRLFYNGMDVWMSKKKESGSLNDLTDGVWRTWAAAVTDKPTEGACIVYHKTWDDNFKTQLSIDILGGQHFRVMNNGSWSAWKTVITNAGGKLTGLLDFQNFNDFYVLKKGRTLTDGVTHFMTMGVANGGAATLEHYHNDSTDFASATIDGRLELRSVPNNPDALILREDNQNGKAYRIFGEHNVSLLKTQLQSLLTGGEISMVKSVQYHYIESGNEINIATVNPNKSMVLVNSGSFYGTAAVKSFTSNKVTLHSRDSVPPVSIQVVEFY